MRGRIVCDCHGTVVMAEHVGGDIVIKKRAKARGSDFKEHHTVKVRDVLSVDALAIAPRWDDPCHR